MRPVSEEVVQKTLKLFEAVLREKIKQKGDRSFNSPHEALGVLTEEYMELIQAVQSNNPNLVREELLDVAVSAIWGVASQVDEL
jgi:NTP pyrophosphatase (non-canonical NTP hydrolase)